MGQPQPQPDHIGPVHIGPWTEKSQSEPTFCRKIEIVDTTTFMDRFEPMIFDVVNHQALSSNIDWRRAPDNVALSLSRKQNLSETNNRALSEMAYIDVIMGLGEQADMPPDFGT